MKQFRPTTLSKLYKIKNPVYRTFDMNHRERLCNVPIMQRIAAKLHHLGSHSYNPDKWYHIERKFYKQHPRF